MILYTMMPQELIFPYEGDDQSRQIMINYEGIPLLVEQTSQQSLQIIRVLSSDPQHFMDERLYPGSKISFTNIDGLSSF